MQKKASFIKNEVSQAFSSGVKHFMIFFLLGACQKMLTLQLLPSL